MIDKKKTLELLNYINTPMSRESIAVLYNAHNIKYEKCELYNDFIQSLIYLVFDTYMGDDITNLAEQKNHFKWCWYTNIDNFKREGITISSTRLYKYFFDFMMEVYYSISKHESEKANKNILKLWSYIFDYCNTKSKSDIDTLVEVYKLFEAGITVE